MELWAGESIVVCREQQLDAVKRVLQRMPLRVSRSSLKRARLKLIVEAVCSGLCGSDVKLSHLLQLTYFEGLTGLEDELEWLISKRLLALQKDGSDVLLRGTQLGRAVLSSSLPPDIALLVYADLERASRALILDNELHLLYLVTPLNNTAVWTGFLDWSHYYTIWSKLPHQLQRVGQMVGVSERFLLEKMRGRVTASSADVQVHLRFISALALFELINERPLITVARRFRINRGALQSLQQQSATYACMVVAFCERLGWVYLRSILDGFSERLAFGVRRELTELVKLLGMDARRARAFHERRITTIASLATTPIEQIAKILRSAVPFVARNGDRAGLNRWLSGEKAMTDLDAATLLAARARQYLASSVRGLGVFSETQLSLLMSTTTDEGMGQRESSCETSTNKANSVLSSKVDNAKQENSVLDQSLLELSACDLFDHSSIYGEECFDEQLLYASQSDNESKNPAKEFAQRNSSSIEHERVFVDEEQQMNQDKENYPPNNVVSDDETNVEKIMKKMSRTSISSSNVQPLASLFTSKSKIRSPRRSSIEMAIKGDGCNKEVDDGSCISTLLDECLGENEENYIPENDKSCILEDKKANIHKNKQFRSRETGGLGLPENERGTLVDLVAVEEKDERTERAEVTVENSKTATIDNTRVKNNGIQTNANGQLGVGQEIGDKEIPSSEEEQQTLGLFDASGDLFEASKSSSLASETPQDVRVKRARQCGSIGSPLSPNCRSPLSKFVKLSSPCSTSSPLTFPDTSSPHSLKKNFSPLAKVDGTYTKTPSRRGEAIRLKMSQDVKGEANSERSRNFVIDDVCRSHSRWLSFTEEVRSWSEIGVGIWLGRHTSRNEVDVIAVALCASDGKPAFIPFDDSCIYGNDREEADFPSCTPVDSISVAERIALFESVLASTEQRKILFDLLAATRALNSPTFSFDLIINRLSNCVCIKTLSFLAHFRTADGESPLTFHELITRVMPSVSVSNIWKAGCSNGRIISSTYAFVNVRLYEYLMPLAIRLSSERSVTLELDSIMLLARLEATGIAFDRKTANDLVEKMKKELSLLEEEGRRLAGIPFNFESPSEIANVLFVRMCIPPVGATGGNSCIGRRHYSTNKNVLHQLAKQHPIAGVILKWRKLNTALSSSLHNLLRLCKSDDRIHCSFTAFSPTGRVQSVNPNVQNVQKDALISSLSVRSLFVAPPGYVLVSADYCQLELRVLAGLSRDPALNELFCSGGDLFEIMADRWNADSSTGITVDRQKMKQLCYAIIYGMGATSLGEQIGVSKQTAQHFIDSFFKKFAKVRSWIDAILERCHQDRCSVTVMGRRRPLKDANSSIQNDRAKAERQAVNSTIQGSASEIFKLALLRLERSLKGVDARIVMQVHDEVIVEVSQASLAIAVERIRNAMCSALPEFPIPLTVKISSGMSWGDLSLMNT
ncbi:DNA polymerase I, thermostable [Toxocara canis]|uniref:DNA polymerase I, thermostable n=1 Tax=Toxocara canis TaxID=6265 RepID=A0A0B2W690_TOXCA|nr:DNA polymerase I, thermostable [Toxocara canis]